MYELENDDEIEIDLRELFLALKILLQHSFMLYPKVDFHSLQILQWGVS